MAIYESVVILDSLMAPKEIDDLVEHFSGVIKEHGGAIRKVDKWGKKRLAFEISKKQYGFYVAFEFESDENIPRVLEGDFNYNDKVMRYLTYKFDKHQIQALEDAAVSDEAAKESAPVVPVKEEPVVEAVKEEAVAEPVVEETVAEAVEESVPEEKKEEIQEAEEAPDEEKKETEE